MPRFVLYVLIIGLSVYAFADCLQTPNPKALPKILWLAIIASVGFVTAFWNIYQQSGGNFDNGPASFGFGMPTIGGGTGGGGDELVL
jgi:hypothetical protein